ncbi:MAG: hypothetical protein EPN94_11015 [Nitrospirae bacterium]|nr:MAG: hypothetical protein EPN94_11015 [Nitrospirota bacterium]
MPSVLTKDGWMVFATQDEADEFRKKTEEAAAESKEAVVEMGETVGLVADEADAPMEPGLLPEQGEEKKLEAEDESPSGFMKSLKKKIGRKN